ncbi:MAG: glycine--tRNA ligase subunit alpha [Elusimicrobia bacterium]|nr:glycine--tRNA ligase subunit alpha [Elusimicrobiota bacterium]
MTFQQIIQNLDRFWSRQNCLLLQPYDVEKGAGTFNPATFFGSLTQKPTRVAYVEPSRRPTDGRYGENPNRLCRYYQYQVLLKPAPKNIQGLYLNSLRSIGLDPKKHDVRWIEDDWESPTLGASGVGWEIWIDAMEVTQFTYFQQMAGTPLDPIPVEITYGLERLALYSQKKKNIFELNWNDHISYGKVHQDSEKQFSQYHFETADTDILRAHFDDYEREAAAILKKGLYLPAYDLTLKCSHAFNLLDARGAISVTERTEIITRIRTLAKSIAHEHINKSKLSTQNSQLTTANERRSS